MKTVLGGVSMKRRVGLASKCLIGAILAGAASSGALAQTAAADDAMPVKASPLVQTDAVAYWWFHGTVEVGGCSPPAKADEDSVRTPLSPRAAESYAR